MNNWETLIAALGIGGSGGILGKKLTDKAQDRKIEANRKAIEMAEQKLIALQTTHLSMKAQLDLNDAMDREFKANFAEHRKTVHADMQDIKISLNMLMKHLLDK